MVENRKLEVVMITVNAHMIHIISTTVDSTRDRNFSTLEI